MMRFLLIQLVLIGLVFGCCPCKKTNGKNSDGLKPVVKFEITETYWKLLSVNGKKLEGPSDSVREAHIILHSDQHRVVGSGGCNRFSGSFNIPEINTVHFKELISTKMACMEVEYEGDFFEALRKTDHFLISSDTLKLWANGSVVAVFLANQR